MIPSRGKYLVQLAMDGNKRKQPDIESLSMLDNQQVIESVSIGGCQQVLYNTQVVEQTTNENSFNDQSQYTICTEKESDMQNIPELDIVYPICVTPGPKTMTTHSRSRCPSRSSSMYSCSTSSPSSSSTGSSFSEDCDNSVVDITYNPRNDNEGESSSSEEIIGDFPPNVQQDVPIFVSPPKKGLKRKKNIENWKRNIMKKSRNSGETYETHTRSKEIRDERKIKQACGQKCRIGCSTKFTDAERHLLFSAYWKLGNINKQRQYVASSMEAIIPRYRYTRIGGTRKERQHNNAFYFMKDQQKVRVCKLFFKNTLDINDRPIRTVQEKRNKVDSPLIESDQRGRHGKQRTLDPVIRAGIRKHIDLIPKIESHYTRANSSRQFIDGSKSLADIHRDYVAICEKNKEPHASYAIFHRIFTEDYNLSFFVPKKDLCSTCVAYDNVDSEEKEALKAEYKEHLEEKDLSRVEKKYDKENFQGIVAVYDLQAVMQIPKGDVSVFYYKSKLNVLNFTIYDLKTNSCECYVWDEANGNRGVNELGTCILLYLKKKATTKDTEVIFYSDNCAGQQKNKFMLALYFYAVQYLGIKSITHKYLIKGHTQNEGDSAHSLIERQVKRQLKGGPIYTPEGFVSSIRAARKQGNAFQVSELCYEDFHDVKQLASAIGPINLTPIKWSSIKQIKVERESPCSILYKTSYKKEYEKLIVIKKKKLPESLNLKLAFSCRPGLSQKKKEDLMELLRNNYIPKFYSSFYSNL